MVRRYQTEGLPGLRTRPRSGRPPLVSKRNMKKVWRALKRTACRTAKEARDLIKEMAGVRYRIPHVRVPLRGRGYTMKVHAGRHALRASRQKMVGFRMRMGRFIPPPEKSADGCTCLKTAILIMPVNLFMIPYDDQVDLVVLVIDLVYQAYRA